MSFETAAGALVSLTLPLGAALTVAGCERLSASSSANRPNVYVAPLVRPVAVQAVDVGDDRGAHARAVGVARGRLTAGLRHEHVPGNVIIGAGGRPVQVDDWRRRE